MSKKNIIAAVVASTVLLGCGSTEPTQVMKPDSEYLWLEEVEGEKSLIWVKQQNAKAPYKVNKNTELIEMRVNCKYKTIFTIKVIIDKKYLPTFNSNVIEAFLWKIPNLAENFIYSNDDTFFGNFVYFKHIFNDITIFLVN